MERKLSRFFLMILTLLFLLPAGAMAAHYPDLPESHWAYYEMDQAVSLGIIKGFEDGRIAPEDTLTWGQYLTMLERTFHSESYAEMNALVTAEAMPWYLSGFYSAQETGLLPKDDFLPVDLTTLEEPILRQDAVVLLERLIPQPYLPYLSRSSSLSAQDSFSDWDTLDKEHQDALARLFQLSVVKGREDGTFGGGETIKRCDGSVLLLRAMNAANEALYGQERQVLIHVVDPQGEALCPPLTAQVAVGRFAEYAAADLLQGDETLGNYRLVSYGTAVTAFQDTYTVILQAPTPAQISEDAFWEAVDRGEASWEDYEMQDFMLSSMGENLRKRVLLFGSEDKRRFASKAEAEASMTTISFPVWKLDKNGNKVSSTASLSIHAAVAEDVTAIFTEIYNDPEQFPIKDIGGYGWRGDNATGEHNCGTAIDINWDENYQIRDGKIQAGSLWKPGENPYSISPDSSVVRIFAEHGWSWGGDAWAWDSDDSEGYHDYMHFSYMGG